MTLRVEEEAKFSDLLNRQRRRRSFLDAASVVALSPNDFAFCTVTEEAYRDIAALLDENSRLRAKVEAHERFRAVSLPEISGVQRCS